MCYTQLLVLCVYYYKTRIQIRDMRTNDVIWQYCNFQNLGHGYGKDMVEIHTHTYII